MIDLHIHSKYSDGKYSIEEIVRKAQSKDISTIAITDHDNIESVKHIVDTLLLEKMLFVPGVELSTESFFFGDKMKIHLLGYGFNYQNQALINSLDNIYCRRANDNKEYIENLTELFNFINLDMFYNFDYGKYGWIRKLILESISSYINDDDIKILNDYLILNKPIYHDYNFKIEEAIEIINNAGGYPVIAHPFHLKLDNDRLRMFIEYLTNCGLKGIETYHNYSTIEQSKFYHSLAERYDLFESGGSDFHSNNFGIVHEQLKNEDNKLVKRLVLEKKVIDVNYGRK